MFSQNYQTVLQHMYYSFLSYCRQRSLPAAPWLRPSALWPASLRIAEYRPRPRREWCVPCRRARGFPQPVISFRPPPPTRQRWPILKRLADCASSEIDPVPAETSWLVPPKSLGRQVPSRGRSIPREPDHTTLSSVGCYWSLVWTHIPVKSTYVPISRLYKGYRLCLYPL